MSIKKEVKELKKKFRVSNQVMSYSDDFLTALHKRGISCYDEETKAELVEDLFSKSSGTLTAHEYYHDNGFLYLRKRR